MIWDLRMGIDFNNVIHRVQQKWRSALCGKGGINQNIVAHMQNILDRAYIFDNSAFDFFLPPSSTLPLHQNSILVVPHLTGNWNVEIWDSHIQTHTSRNVYCATRACWLCSGQQYPNRETGSYRSTYKVKRWQKHFTKCNFFVTAKPNTIETPLKTGRWTYLV